MAEWTEWFDAHLEVAPPVADAQLASIPTKRGVVLLTAEDDAPIVLLTATDLRARTRRRLAEPGDDLPSRRKTPDLRRITRHIFYRRCESRFETDWQFLELARRVWPKRYATMISWKPPWFVHIDLAEAYPHVRRTREVFARSGRYLGPFVAARDAEAFIKALQDAFDLCRSLNCLRRSPNGPRCAYAEMGRCVSPADGTISMDGYRDVLAKAWAFAAGDREPIRTHWAEQMTQFARRQRYEQAAACKTRLDRLGRFEEDRFRYVVPAERFGFVLIQRGAGRREIRAFLSRRGWIESAAPLAFPLQTSSLQAVIKRMVRLSGHDVECDPLGRLRMGLVARTLFAGDDTRRGIVLPWREGLSASDLAEAIEANQSALGLSRLGATKEPTPTPPESAVE